MPDWSRAIVPLAKLKNYLLSESHDTGKSKAVFFKSYGFHAARAEALGREIKNVAERYPVRYEIKSEYGTKYVIDGIILTPTDDAVPIRTVWLIKHGGGIPILVTAYPFRLPK